MPDSTTPRKSERSSFPINPSEARQLVKDLRKFRKKHPWKNEAALVKACITYLRHAGFGAWRINNRGVEVKTAKRSFWMFSGSKGLPDVLALGPAGFGTALAVECKMKYRKQSDDQIVFQQEWERMGGHYIVAYDVDALIKWREGLSGKRKEDQVGLPLP